MAIDREAIIRSCFHGEAVKNWSTTTAGNRRWHMADVTGADHDPDGARRLLDSLGHRDRDGDGVREDAGGHPIAFTLRTNGDNQVRVAMANFVRDDLARVGIRVAVTPVDFNTLMTNFRSDFQYEAALLGLQGGVPPDPAMSANVFRSRGATHWWNVRQPSPETAAEARIDSLVEANIATFDEAVMDRTWREIQTLLNDEAFLIWLPTQKVKVPVRDRFGNVQPSVIPHRLLWNIEWIWARPAGGPS
jgi:peptide/nickel transport system substrate-binding protein